ncbi:RecB family exonuclease [Oleomonas cavernae]
MTARADRVDTLADGRAVVIDYKTGQAPSKAQMAAGYRPQLPLEAAMVAGGAFAEVGPRAVGLIEVWQLKGGNPPGVIKEIPDAAAVADGAVDGVKRLLGKYADQAQPYLSSPNPRQAGYGDYDHLARVGEWADGGDKS